MRFLVLIDPDVYEQLMPLAPTPFGALLAFEKISGSTILQQDHRPLIGYVSTQALPYIEKQIPPNLQTNARFDFLNKNNSSDGYLSWLSSRIVDITNLFAVANADHLKALASLRLLSQRTLEKLKALETSVARLPFNEAFVCFELPPTGQWFKPKFPSKGAVLTQVLRDVFLFIRAVELTLNVRSAPESLNIVLSGEASGRNLGSYTLKTLSIGQSDIRLTLPGNIGFVDERVMIAITWPEDDDCEFSFALGEPAVDPANALHVDGASNALTCIAHRVIQGNDGDAYLPETTDIFEDASTETFDVVLLPNTALQSAERHAALVPLSDFAPVAFNNDLQALLVHPLGSSPTVATFGHLMVDGITKIAVRVRHHGGRDAPECFCLCDVTFANDLETSAARAVSKPFHRIKPGQAIDLWLDVPQPLNGQKDCSLIFATKSKRPNPREAWICFDSIRLIREEPKTT